MSRSLGPPRSSCAREEVRGTLRGIVEDKTRKNLFEIFTRITCK